MIRTLIVAMSLVAFSNGARAGTPEEYRIRANVDPDTGWVRGTIFVRVRVDPVDLDEGIRLWMLPDKLAEPPSALNDLNVRWIYPRRRELGHGRISDASVNGVAAEIERVRPADPRGWSRSESGTDFRVSLPAHVRPGDRVAIRARFEVRVPRRFGRLGRVGDRFSLLAPWYPLVMGDGGGWQFDVPHRVELRDVGRRGSERTWVLGGEPPVEGTGPHVVEQRGPYVPVFAAPRLFTEFVERRGIRVRLLSTESWYRAPGDDATGLDALRDLAHSDRFGPIREAFRGAIDTLALTAASGIDVPRTLLIVPSRTELAANAPGMVLLSDRAFEVFPIDQVVGFQTRALRRAIYRESLARKARRVDGPLDARWAADLRAVWLLDLDLARRDAEVPTPQELLGFAAFNPAIDQLLYAPQVAFVDVYFGAVYEKDPFRDDPIQAREPIARGRLLLEYLRDMAEEQLRPVGEAILHGDSPARDALRDAGVDTEQFETWLAVPQLPLNYRLGEISTHERDDGTHVHRVEVIREGATRAENVEVRVKDRGGHVRTAYWDGRGDRGVVEIETPEELRQAWVDPRGRRPQSAAVAGGHPTRDDTNRLPVRPPIVNRFEPSYAAGFGFRASLGFYRKYDLENSLGLDVAFYPAGHSVSLRYARGFGRTRDLNRRVAAGSIGVAAERVQGDPSAMDRPSGRRYSVFGALGYDDHRFFLDPRHGQSASAALRLAYAETDAGVGGTSVSIALRARMTRSPSWRHVFVLVGDITGVVRPRLWGQLPSVGGLNSLRAYPFYALRGKGRAFLVGEYRLTAFADLHVNLGHTFFVREVQVALFGGAAAVLDAHDGRTFAAAGELGVGARVHFEYGGVQPSLLRIDIAFPLVDVPDYRPVYPFSTVVAFEQFF